MVPKKRTYSETEKLGTMMLALRQGVDEAVRLTGIPQPTIYHWFQEGGGIIEVRNFANQATGFTIATAAQAVALEVQRRAEAGELTNEELVETYRALLPAEKPSVAQAGAHVSVTNVQARQERYEIDPNALAKALLTLRDADALPSPGGAT